MAPRRADLEDQRAAPGARPGPRWSRPITSTCSSAVVAGPALAEGDEARPGGAGGGAQDRGGGEIAVQHRDPARLQPFEDRGLLAGDALEAVEGLQMRGGHGGDHRHVRARQAGQRRDLAGVVHADLDHRELGVARHPRQRQRHAPVVVVAGDRGMGRGPDRARIAASISLVEVLPTLPVTADHPGSAAGASGAAERLQRRLHVGDEQQRRVRRPRPSGTCG